VLSTDRNIPSLIWVKTRANTEIGQLTLNMLSIQTLEWQEAHCIITYDMRPKWGSFFSQQAIPVFQYVDKLYDPGSLIIMTFNITNTDKHDLVQGSCCQSLAPLSNGAAAMLATWSLTSAAGGLKFANMCY
jgi:hypothetical protein